MDLKQELELQINNLILDAQSAHQYNQLYQQKQQKELLRCMLFIYFYNNQIKQINLELITHKLTYNLTIENIQTLKSEQIVNENNLHQANLELENLNTEYIKLSTNLAVVNEKINNNNNNIKRAELELKELLNSKTQICNKITELELQ